MALAAPPVADGVPARHLFSKKITSTSNDLPTEVIKELRAGFKQYIPLSLTTHAACVRATRSGDTFDTEVNFNEQGILLRRKSFSPAKDQYLSMHDFTEVRENFVRGMRRHLILGDDTLPGGIVAQQCASMFEEFFQACMRQSDFSEDWPSYHGFIIESYTAWVGRRDDSYGLIFDEHDLTQFRVKRVTQLMRGETASGRTPSSSLTRYAPASTTFPVVPYNAHSSASYAAVSYASRSRGRALPPSRYTPTAGRAPGAQSFRPSRCFLCGGSHHQRDHKGGAKRLTADANGAWVDRGHGNRIVCISYNVGTNKCTRPACTFSHSCSLCGELSHGCSECTA